MCVGVRALYQYMSKLRLCDFQILRGEGAKKILTPNISAPLSPGPPIFTIHRGLADLYWPAEFHAPMHLNRGPITI